ncbi:MAG: hypothetical protein ISS59_02790 [Desulfobacteraceae bacterium]|nr:hypothetical protein [Desulfobacteraceae bacterium]
MTITLEKKGIQYEFLTKASAEEATVVVTDTFLNVAIKSVALRSRTRWVFDPLILRASPFSQSSKESVP